MKYSPELTEMICQYIESGNNVEDSSALCDISKETFYKWKKTKHDFSDAIKKAELKCKARNIRIILKEASGDFHIDKNSDGIEYVVWDKKPNWFAAAWWMERKYKEEFAQRIQNDYRETEMKKTTPDKLLKKLSKDENITRAIRDKVPSRED